MKNFVGKILQADERAHHHTAMVLAGVFLCGFMAFWQLLMPQIQTHASYDPDWCTTHSGSIDIPFAECQALADFYVSTDGDNWTINSGWFDSTTICDMWYGIGCEGMPFVTDMEFTDNNLSGYLPSSLGSFTGLERFRVYDNTIGGEVPESLWEISTLVSVSINSNNFSGVFNPDFSAITDLQWLTLDRNQNLLVDLDAFATIVRPELFDRLTFENVLVTGDLTTISRFTGLTIFALDGYQGEDASPVLSVILDLPNLINLKLKRLNLAGYLPDIWYNFPNLQELDFQFNDFVGPLPDSLATLTGLTNLVLSFNHFDGPIPSYLETFVNISSQYATINTNCFDTTNVGGTFETYLDQKFAGWESQYNCRSNVILTGTILGSGLSAGSCSMYEISYENIGPQTAKTLKIGQIFDPQIIVGEATPAYTTGIVGSAYGTDEDPCYIDAAVNATGPYYAALESIVQTNYGAPSLYAVAVNGLGFTGAQYTTEFAYVMDNACPSLFGTDDRALCFILFGQDMSEVDPSCGIGGSDGYLWNMGDITNGGTGIIDVELCLPENATGTISFQSLVTTVSTNENSDGGSQFFNFVVTNPNGDDEEEAEDNTGGGRGPGRRSPEPTHEAAPVDEEQDAPVDDEKVDPTDFIPQGAVIQNYLASLSDVVSATTEEVSAFLFAKAAGLTTMTDFTTVRPYDGITRAEFSKLLVAFLENVLQRKADGDRLSVCSRYNDVNSSLGDLEISIYKACIYGVMGLQNDGETPLDVFDPHAVLTRKDVVTTIDRIINGTANDGAYPYYINHMQAMYDAGLISNTDPDKAELRINAFMIFERIVEQFDTLFK